MAVRCDERHCIPRINYVHSPDGELLRECPGITSTMHTGFSAYTYLLLQRPGADTEETGRYDFSVERFV